MTQTLIEKLEALPRYSFINDTVNRDDNRGQWCFLDDLLLIIEEHKRESACQYGKDVGMPEYSCAVKCQYAQPSHTQLIGELLEALESNRRCLVNPSMREEYDCAFGEIMKKAREVVNHE